MHNANLNQQRNIAHARAVAKAIREADDKGQTVYLPGSLPGDRQALRGIPVVGGIGNLGGAIRDTRPDALPFLDNIRRGRHHQGKR